MMKERFARLAVSVAAAVLFTALGVCAAAAGEVDCTEPVKTAQGLIKGMEDPDYPACVWKGVPYAAPPVGELRLAATRPPEPHEGIYEAYEYGPACPQEPTVYSGGKAGSYSEDCLYLNIWRPKKSGLFPVMYWIHGGGFKQGSANFEMSDGARLAAEKEVVVVGVDYRVGILGFLALPELAAEDPNGSTGNYGILDQIQGLKWVQENIKGFGGDPDNVTVFGQSAGGMSACVLLASPLAKGLFHRAIPMSGSCDVVKPLEEGYKDGKEILKSVGCDGPAPVSCLRSKTAKELTPKGKNTLIEVIKGGMNFGPHLDGYVLVKQPLDAFKEGDFNRVPVMLGHTRDEVKLYTLFFPGLSLWPKWVVNKLMKWIVGEDRMERVMELYSYSDYKRPIQLFYAVANDVFISRGYMAAEALSPWVPVYYYRFDWDDTRFRNKAGAFHGLDEPMVFGSLEMDSTLAKVLANKKAKELGAPLSEIVMSYYANFARNGDPNGPGLPEWPPYTREKKERLYFDNEITVAPLSPREIERYEYFSQFSWENLSLKERKEN